MEPTRHTVARIAIIACTKQKRSTATRALELYDRSPLFRLSVTAARREGLEVLVLSTKYGLVKPDVVLQPYEADLRQMSTAERSTWQSRLGEQARALVVDRGVHEVVCFAGQEYRDTLRAVCQPLGIRVSAYQDWRRICDDAFGRDDS